MLGAMRSRVSALRLKGVRYAAEFTGVAKVRIIITPHSPHSRSARPPRRPEALSPSSTLFQPPEFLEHQLASHTLLERKKSR